jgi:hypothetical protein
VAQSSVGTPLSRLGAVSAIVLGLVLTITALLADVIGIGGGGEGIGWKQMIAAIAGVVIALAGIATLRRPSKLAIRE